MDLISREVVKEQAKASYHVAESMEQLGNLYEDCINAIPSAFEGMTNGEVIKALFPNAEIEYWAEYSTYNIEFPNDNDVKHFSYSWWNLPYKKGGEGDK